MPCGSQSLLASLRTQGRTQTSMLIVEVGPVLGDYLGWFPNTGPNADTRMLVDEVGLVLCLEGAHKHGTASVSDLGALSACYYTTSNLLACTYHMAKPESLGSPPTNWRWARCQTSNRSQRRTGSSCDRPAGTLMQCCKHANICLGRQDSTPTQVL